MWLNKNVVILGAARQGTALTRWLVAQGARVTLSDANTQADVSSLSDIAGKITFALGGHPITLLDGCDALCLSGGVPIDLPIVLEAKRRDILLSNDSQIFFDVCAAPVTGITGSAGKTTTTTLVGEMLNHGFRGEGRKVWVGGNIGNPLIGVAAKVRPTDFVVMELSSFQLELMTRSPHVACITNITPNHLDRHATMEAYAAAKKHILDFQGAEDWAVLNADDPVSRELVPHGHAAWFSFRQQPLGDGAWMDERGDLRVRVASRKLDAAICNRKDLLLMGDHNVVNVLTAALVAGINGASAQAMGQVATTFRGVAHRLQLVSEARGAKWYDDSIATAPERLMAALRCFDQPVILLVGGRDKHLPWDEAAELMARQCKHVILFGEMGPMVQTHLQKDTPNTLVSTLHEAVHAAAGVVGPGDVVLLSPGGTSYDAFKDFAERGDVFTRITNYEL